MWYDRKTAKAIEFLEYETLIKKANRPLMLGGAGYLVKVGGDRLQFVW